MSKDLVLAQDLSHSFAAIHVSTHQNSQSSLEALTSNMTIYSINMVITSNMGI